MKDHEIGWQAPLILGYKSKRADEETLFPEHDVDDQHIGAVTSLCQEGLKITIAGDRKQVIKYYNLDAAVQDEVRTILSLGEDAKTTGSPLYRMRRSTGDWVRELNQSVTQEGIDAVLKQRVYGSTIHQSSNVVGVVLEFKSAPERIPLPASDRDVIINVRVIPQPQSIIATYQGAIHCTIGDGKAEKRMRCHDKALFWK